MLPSSNPSGQSGPSTATATPSETRPAWFSRRTLLISALALAALALTGLLPGSDWSDGAVRMALVALAGAVVFVIALRRWVNNWHYDRRMPRSTLVVLTILFILGALGIGLQGTLQYAQGQLLESQQSFAAAIHEFQRCSDSGAQARAYYAWGRQLHAQRQYQPALDQYASALRITHDADLKQQTTEAEALTYYTWGQQLYSQGHYDTAALRFSQALQVAAAADLISSVKASTAQNDLSWGAQMEAQGQYDQAITQYLAALIYEPSGPLTPQLNESLARVYYTYGQQLESSKQYSQAISKFTSIFLYTQTESQLTQTREAIGQAYLAWITSQVTGKQYADAISTYQTFAADSHSLKKTKAYPAIHREVAKAYLAQARKTIAAGDCYNGASDYDELIAHYGDTPEGKTALAARAKPQNVTGQIVEYGSGKPAAFVRLYLSAQWSVTILGFTASNDYSTLSDAKGRFTFANIPTGKTTYLISYIDQNGNEAVTVRENQFGLPTADNAVTVSPYCPAHAGAVVRDAPISGGGGQAMMSTHLVRSARR